MVEQSRNRVFQRIQDYSEKRFIPLKDALAIAGNCDCSLRDVEQTALEESIMPARFKRNGLSCQEQLRLLQSRVAIIGCGGLGGRSAELLARLGIGHLLLTDPDSFSESNLNRQIFSSPKNLGVKKVDVLAKELGKINPSLILTTIPSLFDKHSIAAADIVIDGLDTPKSKVELSKICRTQKIPMIHGAVKEWYGQAGIDQAPNWLIDTLYHTPSSPQSPQHVFSINVALIASIQTAETCKLLLGHHSSLREGWLQTDLLHCEYATITIP